MPSAAVITVVHDLILVAFNNMPTHVLVFEMYHVIHFDSFLNVNFVIMMRPENAVDVMNQFVGLVLKEIIKYTGFIDHNRNHRHALSLNDLLY